MTCILLVDDDRSLHELLGEYLQQREYVVLHANDGREGLKIVFEKRPDLVILDVMMPRKDGYVVCDEIKKDDQYKDITVVLLTAVGDAVTTTQYTHFGGKTTLAEDFIPKPIDLDKLMDIVKENLE